MVDEHNFPIWKIVTVGVLGNAEDTRKQLADVGVKVSSFADDMLDCTTFEHDELKVELVRVSIKELGLNGDPRTSDIYAAALLHGLSPCPEEVGPLLLITYPDLLQKRDIIHVATEVVLDAKGGCNIFSVTLDYHKDRWLHDHGGGEPVYRWSRDSHWVFALNG